MIHRILFLVFIMATGMSSFSQTWNWANGTRGSNNYGRFSSIDTAGNIYVAGEAFTGMNFTTDTIPNVGYTRVYLSKFDSAGNLLWAKANSRRNTTGRIGVLGLASDNFGNTFLLGAFDSVISFDANVLSNSYMGTYADPVQKSYLFLAKFDASGNNQWVKSIGNFPCAFWNIGNSIKADCAGNIYLICNFYHGATIGSFSFSNNDTSGNTSDMLVAKLDNSGAIIWAKQFGGDSIDYVVNIALTPSNDIFITGSFFHYKLIIGRDTLTDTSGIRGYATSFVTKLDNSGSPIWTKLNGDGTYDAYIHDIKVNAGSEYFTTGWYSKDYVLGGRTLPFAANSNSYLAKYDIYGNLVWVKTISGINPYTECITLDGCGNAWLLGHFGPDIMTTNDTIDGHVIPPPVKNKYPIFISGWSSVGTYLHTAVLPSGGRCGYRFSTTLDKANNLYVVGNNTLDTLNISGDTLYGTNSGANMFLAKYTPGLECAANSWQICNSLGVGNDVDELKPNEISIFPNPANSECTIRSNTGNGTANCSIFDITGRLLITFPLLNKDTIVPTGGLNSGIYIFRIEFENSNSISKKVSIIK